MPRRRTRRSAPSRSGVRSRSRRKKEPALLILECDPETLAAQAISMARELEGIARLALPSIQTRLVAGASSSELLQQLGSCKEENDHFSHVVVIGHSNARGLRLARDLFTPWESFAAWVKPFGPKCMVLVACEAGRWLPSSDLFRGISTLQEIYGSPVVTTEAQAAAIKVLVPYLLSGNRLPKDILPLQLLNFALTQGVIFRQIRKDFRQATPSEGVLWTGWEMLLKQVLGR